MPDEEPRRRSSDKDLDKLVEKLDELLKVLYGAAEKPGFFTRIFLLEQSDKRQWWYIAIITALMVGVAIKGIAG